MRLRNPWVAMTQTVRMNGARTATALADIEAELSRFGSGCAIDAVLPEVHRVLDTETVLVLTPAESLGGLDVARFHAVGFADPAGLRDAFVDVFRRQPLRYAWYNPICPEPEQRNRLVEAHDLMEPGELEQSYIYERLLRPLGLHVHRQPRVLLCDGASLLAWFGSFHTGVISAQQRKLLAQIAPLMHRRLAVERRLGRTAAQPALGGALEHIGAPAFVLAGPDRIVDANAAGRALLDTRRADIAAALAGAVTVENARGELEIEVVPLRMNGCPDLSLAIIRAGTREVRIEASVAAAAARWQLTPRQREILTRVLRGDASPTIAADLGVSRRTIELHLSALFERTDTTTRAELVAAALLA